MQAARMRAQETQEGQGSREQEKREGQGRQAIEEEEHMPPLQEIPPQEAPLR